MAERKEGVELGDEQFSIDVDDAIDDRPQRGGSSGRGDRGKSKASTGQVKQSLPLHFSRVSGVPA